MTLHVMVTPTEGKKHWKKGSVWEAPARLADDYHVYGLEWDRDEIRFYFDGKMVYLLSNTHWHQPLHMNFDSETMPDWFGLPAKETLPSTFSIEYVRAWKRVEPAKTTGGTAVRDLPSKAETANKGNLASLPVSKSVANRTAKGN